LLSIAFISVAAGFYYYLKVVKAMYWNTAKDNTSITVPVITKVVLILITAAILILGIYPQPIFSLLGQ
jgi:NADH-quinone oxidoreductase subunit N